MCIDLRLDKSNDRLKFFQFFDASSFRQPIKLICGQFDDGNKLYPSENCDPVQLNRNCLSRNRSQKYDLPYLN